MSDALRAYLDLERALAVALDERHGEEIRTRMDVVWRRLTAADVAWLATRPDVGPFGTYVRRAAP